MNSPTVGSSPQVGSPSLALVWWCFVLFCHVLNHIRGSYNSSLSQTAWSYPGHSSQPLGMEWVTASEVWIRRHCTCSILLNSTQQLIFAPPPPIEQKQQQQKRTTEKSGIHRRAVSRGEKTHHTFLSCCCHFCYALWRQLSEDLPTFVYLCYSDRKHFQKVKSAFLLKVWCPICGINNV